jgi:hypothetical protein
MNTNVSTSGRKALLGLLKILFVFALYTQFATTANAQMSSSEMIENLLDQYDENLQDIEDLIDEANSFHETMNDASHYGEEPYYTPNDPDEEGDPNDVSEGYATGDEVSEGLEEEIEEFLEEINLEIHMIEVENEFIEDHLGALGYPIWC